LFFTSGFPHQSQDFLRALGPATGSWANLQSLIWIPWTTHVSHLENLVDNDNDYHYYIYRSTYQPLNLIFFKKHEKR
jgi:hypothetical protein